MCISRIASCGLSTTLSVVSAGAHAAKTTLNVVSYVTTSILLMELSRCVFGDPMPTPCKFEFSVPVVSCLYVIGRHTMGYSTNEFCAQQKNDFDWHSKYHLYGIAVAKSIVVAAAQIFNRIEVKADAWNRALDEERAANAKRILLCGTREGQDEDGNVYHLVPVDRNQ